MKIINFCYLISFFFLANFTNAQSLLFSVNMGPKLVSNADSNQRFKYLQVEELGSPEKPIALLCYYRETHYPNDGRISSHHLKILSFSGLVIQEINIEKLFPEGISFGTDDSSVSSLGNSDGRFVLQFESVDIFFGLNSGRWTESLRIYKSIGNSNTSNYVGQRGARRYDFLGYAYSSEDDVDVIVDVYVTDLAAFRNTLPPAPVITSSLETLYLKKGSAMARYIMKCNFVPTGFRAVLPPGLTYNRRTGSITGTPTVTGKFTVTIIAYGEHFSVRASKQIEVK